jgi:hypothetical protein
MYWLGMSEETYARISQFGGFILLALINVHEFQRLIITLEQGGMRFFVFIYYLLAH